MKSIALHKAVNVVKSSSWTSQIEFLYLVETSQCKFDFDRTRAQKHGQVYTPKPWESLPYLAKEDMGKIHVRGFLHDQVAQNPDGTFSHPSSLSTEDIIRRLSRAWKTHAKVGQDIQITHHRLVFSMSKEFHDALVAAGRNPDMALRGIIEKSMRSFQENFHPGDSVGYSYGLHHDTDNLHAHVFIHPRTRKGEFVGMSEQLQRLAARGAHSRHKNQLRYVRETARRHASQVLKQLSDPKEATLLNDNFYSDRSYYLPRQRHTARTKNDFRPRTPADYHLERKRSAIAALKRRIAEKSAALREAAKGRNIAAIVRLRQPKWVRLLEKTHTATLYRELRELQAQHERLHAEYRVECRRLYPAPDATKTVLKRKRQTKASAPTVTLRAPKPTVRIRSKPSTPKIGF
jgi:hypothetical protein